MLNAIARMPRVIGALMLREMATTYGKSPGGYIWAVLEPAAGVMVLAFGFSLLMRTPPVGDNFLLFYATGVLPFTMYGDISGKVAVSIQFSKQLLAYPGVTFLDAVLARLFLNALTQLMVVYIILGMIMVVYDPDVILDLPRIVLALVLALLLGAGIGILNCFLFSYYPLYKQLWAIATRPLMLVSAIFFTYESLPTAIQGVLWYNPLIHIVGLMRTGFYMQYHGEYISVAYVLVCAMVPLIFGLFFLNRFYRVILYEM